MSSQLGAEISETILLRPHRRSAPATIDTLLMLVVYVSTAPDLSSFVVGVNKVGDVAHNESFTGFKSKEHCRVTARVNACYQHHLQRRRSRRRIRFNHINTIIFLLKNGERRTVYGRPPPHIYSWSWFLLHFGLFILWFFFLCFKCFRFPITISTNIQAYCRGC